MSLISVIVPCYNQAQYLSEALESVLNQSLQDWECIIVDDGSTDNTAEIALDLTKRDSRIKYVKKKMEAYQMHETMESRELALSGFYL